jgi:ketosteroid isomerase-like protein
MSQENVEVVQRFLDAFNRRDREAVGALFHPQVEWHTMAGPLFGVEAMNGREEALDFMFEGIDDAIEDFRVFAEVHELPGGRVISVGRYEGRGTGSGAPVETNAAAIWRVEQGVIVFFQDFPTRAEALEAVGLRG